MKLLIANVGSTSLKFKLFEMDAERVLASGRVERIGKGKAELSFEPAGGVKVTLSLGKTDYRRAIGAALDCLRGDVLPDLSELAAVGFKTVHTAGEKACVYITPEVEAEMTSYNDIAPAHNPPYLTAIEIFRALLPKTPLVALFEPAFHRDIPDHAYTYGIPYRWYAQYGIRRYGFHGASHRWVSERVPELLERSREDLKIISCHLGGSGSLCAMKGGVSVDTSMGFSLQTGIEHANRCGDIDPFIIPFVMRRERLTVDQVCETLNREGGLAGISGTSGDMRDVRKAAESGDYRAGLAIRLYAYGIKKYIGAYAAVLGGVDAIAFTGGIGEHDGALRARVCEGLKFLGLMLDADKNQMLEGEGDIATDDSPGRILVVPANEEIVVAREVHRLIASGKGSSRP